MQKNTNTKKRKIVSVDGLRKIKKANTHIPPIGRGLVVPSSKELSRKIKIAFKMQGVKKLPIALSVFLLLIGFAFGLWSSWDAKNSEAETQVLGAYTERADQPAPTMLKVSEVPGTYESVAKIPNDVFYTFTIDQLENQIREMAKTPEMREAEILALRKEGLKKYLDERDSPFVEIVDTIAELKHWKIVLAVSNSESSLGKRCADENCSGIGVEPGHPLWRKYPSKREWAKDLDRLIEKRYKNWTLEQMNGVYNQPGSKNWVKAARQVLEDLEERGVN